VDGGTSLGAGSSLGEGSREGVGLSVGDGVSDGDTSWALAEGAERHIACARKSPTRTTSTARHQIPPL